MRQTQEKNCLFEQFWKIYPRHEVKLKARKAFERINPSENVLRDMLQWIEQAKYSQQWQNPQYIPHPATWLNRRQWEDDVPPIRVFPEDLIGLSLEPEKEPSDEVREAIAKKAKMFEF
jgi:hypothetical protein